MCIDESMEYDTLFDLIFFCKTMTLNSYYKAIYIVTLNCWICLFVFESALIAYPIAKFKLITCYVILGTF